MDDGIPVVSQATDGGDVILIWDCPGCGYGHFARIQSDNPKATRWKWNGSLSKPTFSPSIVVKSQFVCHILVASGYVSFLPDCTHHLKGQTVKMEPA